MKKFYAIIVLLVTIFFPVVLCEENDSLKGGVSYSFIIPVVIPI